MCSSPVRTAGCGHCRGSLAKRGRLRASCVSQLNAYDEGSRASLQAGVTPVLAPVSTPHDPAVVGIDRQLDVLAVGIDGIDQIDAAMLHGLGDAMEVSPLQLAHDLVRRHLAVALIVVVVAEEPPQRVHAAVLHTAVVLVP